MKIVDPFEGETDFQIDEVNRVTQCTLPNNQLTIYGYKDTMEPLAAFQDKDNLVRSIDHKFGGTSLIQLTYQRKPGGEPQIIQRFGGDFSDTRVNLVHGNLTPNDQLKAADGVTYTNDAMERRVKAVKGTAIRHFIVGPIPSGLESPLLISDENGGLIAGFEYHGDHPLMRFTNGSQQDSTRYYLEDVMDSVVGLANQNGAEVAQFRYDAFGNLLASTRGDEANPADGLEGDYRFHGDWLENSTQLYHMRARDYDPVTRRFLTRDPVEGNPQAPETFNPYAFPQISLEFISDPTDGFTLVELNVVGVTQFIGKSKRAVGAHAIKQRVKRQLSKVLTDQLKDAIELLFPGFSMPLPLPGNTGKKFESLVQREFRKIFCGKDLGISEKIDLSFPVSTNGKAHADGISGARPVMTSEEMFFRRFSSPIPNFIIGKKPSTKAGSWLIGDFKGTTGILYKGYIKSDGSTDGRKRFQEKLNNARKKNVFAHSSICSRCLERFHSSKNSSKRFCEK